MQTTAPNARYARLLPATIKNIDPDRNLLCPCATGICIDAGDTMPNFCVPVYNDGGEEGSREDSLLFVLAVMIPVVGLVMGLAAG